MECAMFIAVQKLYGIFNFRETKFVLCTQQNQSIMFVHIYEDFADLTAKEKCIFAL
jgi:hypothetical protein